MREPKDVHILVVDDEPSLRKAIAFDFTRKGFNVVQAENGAQAFEIIRSSNIDVVLTDVRMPGGDGIELLDKIKGLNPRLPVVMFITGFADITFEQAYDKGVDAIFAKPFERKALFSAVLRAISEKSDQWNFRDSERLAVNHSIELKLPELETAIQGKCINIGRGGAFVAVNENFPVLDSKVNFNISFNDGTPKNLVGRGIVRWVRTQKTDQEPSGYGIEFEYLEEDGRLEIIEYINKLKTKSFIPKS